jgi:hypothetical protein
MMDGPTLFILGAVASVPYGYHTGKEFRKDIVDNFSKVFEGLLNTRRDQDEHNEVNNPIELEQAKKFVDVFNKSRIESIDKFLSLNPRFSSIGKIAITLSILRKEKSSHFPEAIGPSKNDQDWYSLLFNRMISSCTNPDDLKNLVIIRLPLSHLITIGHWNNFFLRVL